METALNKDWQAWPDNQQETREVPRKVGGGGIHNSIMSFLEKPDSGIMTF